jgi:8-oxo-dGTP pyrophosphatase MutT (NUDIX family)
MEETEEELLAKRRQYCLNCGKRGHISKRCKDPPTSYGIICFKINNEWSIYQTVLQMKYFKNPAISIVNNINLYWFNNKNKDIRDNIAEFLDKVKLHTKFLLIRRKNSLGYIEFVRGRYDHLNEKSIVHLLRQMTDEEKEVLVNEDFDSIWENLWRNTSHNSLYQKEYTKSLEKFNYLKENNINLIKTTASKYTIPEWGFPKGRRNYMEKDIECGKREFMEETNLKDEEFILLDRIYPLQESFYGTNQIKYKHTYYLATCLTQKTMEIIDNPEQIQEIGDIGWYSYDEIMNLLRPYHSERKKLVEEIIYFIAFNIKFYQENDTIKTLKLEKK